MNLVLFVGVLVVAVMKADELTTTDKSSQEPFVVNSVDERYPNNGGYKFLYELSDGSMHEEEGRLKYGYISVKGSYAWNDDAGKHRINYTAGTNGYHSEVVEGAQEVIVPEYLAKARQNK